jgi:hypothetical protein
MKQLSVTVAEHLQATDADLLFEQTIQPHSFLPQMLKRYRE